MIDTNVIIDVYQNRYDFVENSGKVLRLSETNKITGFITASTVTDIYFILGRHIKDREALKALVQKMLTSVTLADVLAKDVTDSFNLPLSDFEDALLAQCAKRLRTDYIVTRNIEDFINSPVQPITPDDFLGKFFLTQ
jgi:predicted nucleic acid-binding protein